MRRSKYDFDLMVIGGGAAGLTASGFSASLGAKTALVEAKKLGGDCTWYGCVPSKALIKTARIVHYMRTADRYGLKKMQPEFDFAKIMNRVHNIQHFIYEDADAPPRYAKLGVSVMNAQAKFLNDHTVELSEMDGSVTQMSSRYFVIATGGRAIIPEIDGISSINYLTNETVFSLTELPGKWLIIGAGPIGTEMAQAFRRLGSEVVVTDKGNRILPKDDEELADLLRQELVKEGVQYILKTKVKKFANRNGRIQVTLQNSSNFAESHQEADAVLLATGRQPNLEELNLQAAGVDHDSEGIKIDKHCRTSRRHIFACGDVTGGYLFTHFAEHMAKVAVSNALLHFPASLDSNHITWCTYTEPELAHVGATERQLLETNTKYQTYRFPFSKIDRAITESETTGWIKVFAKEFNGKIYGVNILGAHAGDMIAEYALAIRNGITLRKISDTIHPYPTYGLGNRRAADQWYVRKQSRMIISWLQRIFGYRGKLPDTSAPDRIL